MTVTLRRTKGSALTHAELDANFETIEQAALEIATAISTKAAAHTLTNTERTTLVDTTSVAFTTKLPPTPVDGQLHTITKINATSNAHTTDGNGNNLQGSSATIGTGATVTRISTTWQFRTGSGWWAVG